MGGGSTRTRAAHLDLGLGLVWLRDSGAEWRHSQREVGEGEAIETDLSEGGRQEDEKTAGIKK